MKLALALVMAAMTVSAVAQRGTDFGRPIASPENQADAALRGAARCAFQAVPSSVRKVLDTGIGSADEAKRVKGLVGVARVCFPPQWPAMPPTPFRDALAEVSYREAYQVTDNTPPPSSPPETFSVVPVGTTGTAAQEAAWQMAALAACSVYAGPVEARHWVIGPRNVDEEERRFAAFKPAVERCGGAKALAVLTARNFRGPVANALYERATHASGK